MLNSTAAFPLVTILVLNCNLLKISIECDNNLQNIIVITILDCDIIFLSDPQLCCCDSYLDKICKLFIF